VIIIGIDPGYAITGYGVIKFEKNKFKILEYGAISTKAKTPFELRLLEISRRLEELCEKHHPDSMAVEELFFSRNTTTAIGTAQARGVAVLSGARAGIGVYEYTPMQVKMAVTGYGRADKKQVDYMVKLLLGIKDKIKPDDVTDALAVAICHAHTGIRKSFQVQGGYQ
jgi:crossover junction endodeoxyribonuclease RuvC